MWDEDEYGRETKEGCVSSKINLTLCSWSSVRVSQWFCTCIYVHCSQADVEKDKGNVAFKAGKFNEAVMRYTDAIAICPLSARSKQSIYYRWAKGRGVFVGGARGGASCVLAGYKLSPKFWLSVISRLCYKYCTLCVNALNIFSWIHHCLFVQQPSRELPSCQRTSEGHPRLQQSSLSRPLHKGQSAVEKVTCIPKAKPRLPCLAGYEVSEWVSESLPIAILYG